ncbi:MAG TPA: hypothetical protein VLT35_02950, partial [Methanocella sp.]|nr:hypothetical protein [Methanocella sp.]
MAGASISVSVTGPGSVAPASALTNASGYASFTITALTTVGTLAIRADCPGCSSNGSLQVVAGPPATLQVLSSSGLIPANGYSTYTLEARAKDSYGNGCAGWPVNVTVDGIVHVVNA